ncbi:hypothetical protein GCM10011609_86130 [Lentzea pudingi]|uniref:S-adenosyl methyltransferase n=1 Tax=Lentzea pudingi TaxID=1789439 RepID=A0ABQ2ITM5_9PSEU|nr:SAM-dependent methyltransferase [Lentzea pudingi]GGN29243.1 hypothetical protein GCM10011609_86130 [Lentzea pudingi]
MVDSDQEQFPPHGVDLENPSVARVYDYLLDGGAHWEIDRTFADQALREVPSLKSIAKANRSFLHRVVRHLTRRGIRQFVDIGSGLPTMGAAHQIAEQVAPGEVSVVYADNDPLAVAHSELLLGHDGDPARHAAVHADLRDPDRLWSRVGATGVIDLSKPVALLLVAVLHTQQPGTDGTDIGPQAVARYRDLIAPQSYLALSHITDQDVPDALGDGLVAFEQMCASVGTPALWRSREQIEELFGSFPLLTPGPTWIPLWHPEDASSDAPVVRFETPNESALWGGVARKP